MYLANIHPIGRPHYVIRETRRDGNYLLGCDLCDLGPNPERHIRYPGGNAFYVHERVEETVRENGGRPGMHEIEDLLWHFVAPDIRHAVEYFHARGRSRAEPGTGDPPHPFDQRRIAYLRCGPTASGRSARVPERLVRPLVGKSRDEREQLFLDMEDGLRAHEYKRYLFSAFDLQRHFTAHFGRSVPQWIDSVELDRHFENEICHLQRDADFWGGMPPGPRLNDYLVRYAIMFFDGDFGRPSLLESMINDYINNRRRFMWPDPARKIGMEEAGRIFELPVDTLKAMTRREITRHYRRMALRLHPDQGGDHGRFVQLTEVYQALLRRRTKQRVP